MTLRKSAEAPAPGKGKAASRHHIRQKPCRPRRELVRKVGQLKRTQEHSNGRGHDRKGSANRQKRQATTATSDAQRCSSAALLAHRMGHPAKRRIRGGRPRARKCLWDRMQGQRRILTDPRCRGWPSCRGRSEAPGGQVPRPSCRSWSARWKTQGSNPSTAPCCWLEKKRPIPRRIRLAFHRRSRRVAGLRDSAVEVPRLRERTPRFGKTFSCRCLLTPLASSQWQARAETPSSGRRGPPQDIKQQCARQVERECRELRGRRCSEHLAWPGVMLGRASPHQHRYHARWDISRICNLSHVSAPSSQATCMLIILLLFVLLVLVCLFWLCVGFLWICKSPPR